MSKQVKNLWGGVGSLLGERWREIVLLSTLLVSLFAVLALLGYEPADPTWLSPGTGRVQNPCGPVGALLADTLFQTFGYGAWMAFGVMVGCVLALAGRVTFDPLRWASFASFYAAVLGILHIALGGEGSFPAGGRLGAGIAEGLSAGFGVVGAVLALVGVLLVCVTFLGHIRWGALARSVVDAGEAHIPAVKDVAGRGASGAQGVLTRSGRSVGGAIWNSVTRSWAGVYGLTSRIARSFRPVESDGPILDTGLESIDTDPDLFVPSDSVATAHSVPVVAEVKWEPTASEEGEVKVVFTDLSPRDVSTGGVAATGAGSQVLPEPLDTDDRTQPGQFEHTVASESEGDAFVAEVPMSFGVTLTPDPRSVTDEPEPVQERVSDYGREPAVETPRPARQRRELGLEIAEALAEKVEDDGGSVSKRQGWSDFQLPKLSLLDIVPEQKAHFDGDALRALASKVEETLASFKVTGEVVNVRVGPVVTIFEFLPNAGIKVSRIAGLSDDLAMSLKALSVRIVAPIPGKGVVGIEIPSPKRLNIYFRELLASEAFRGADYELPVALGKNVEGKPIVANLVKMPHLLVAGTTGAGKSVGVNGMLVSMLFTCPPDDLRLLLIDPKQLEFKMYDDIPHLLHPVVTDPKKAEAALAWCVREMEDRYSMLAAWNTRNIVSFNEKVERESKDWNTEKARRYAPKGWEEGMPLPGPEKMPFIVIVIDELADLMMVAKKEIEQSVARLAQKARACGIHLILATQRPSADVVTGLIKSNMPTRIAFKLKSALDSRVILDENGAERLLGRGDMLHSPNGGEVERVHGAFVSDEEVERVCDYLRSQAKPDYIEAVTQQAVEDGGDSDEERDPLFNDAVDIVVGAGKASTSMVQRHLKIGYNRAARIVDQMESAGIIGPADGARPRAVLV